MLHPILLTGALFVGLPILLHLIMRQEPKKLPFPAFRFLKQRQRINQRKLRLRHWLLLALRMFLIAILALALFQPSLYSDRFHIRGEQPIATVIVLDTSPGMGYQIGNRTRFDEAKHQALELLNQIPEKSPVAVLDTGDPVLDRDWLPSVSEARKVVEAINGTKSIARPVSTTIEAAYRLLQKVDAQQESPDSQALPRLLGVFSDRTVSSWETSRLADLQLLKERIPPPEMNAVYLDVGVEKPINLAITAAQMSPQILAADQPMVLNVTLQASGQDLENVLMLRLDSETTAERQPVKLAAGESKTFTFRRTGLKPGMHSVEVSLFSPDALPADNVRFFTFRVREPREILTLVDDASDATVWQLAMRAFRMFTSEIKTPRDVLEWKPEQWNRYEVVVVLSVKRPAELWGVLEGYLQRGGNVLLLPGGDELLRDDYQSAAAKKVIPGEFVELREADAKTDVTWLWNSLNYQHPLLSPFREWQQQNNLDFIRFPPKVFRYWSVKPLATESVIVAYNDADKSPAVLERTVGRGRLMMFTTPMDARRDADDRFWNDYLQTSFFLVMSNNSLRYLAGDTEDVNFNYLCGQSVSIPLPITLTNKSANLLLEGPNVTGSEALLRPATDGKLLFDRDKTINAGNFFILGDNRKVIDGFSLNTDAQESDLQRVAVEEIEALLGTGSVVSVDKGFQLSDRLESRFTQPVDLFPWLMLLVLFLFVMEGLLANRFYRQPKTEAK